MLSIEFSFLAAGASPLYAFEQSDVFAKIILFVLFFTSIFAWTIIVDKWLAISALSSNIHEGIKAFRENPRAFLADLQSSGPLQDISQEAMAFIADEKGEDSGALAASLSDQHYRFGLKNVELETLKARTETVVDERIMSLEDRLGLLSSIVSVSPFLGLLGTVWGVMLSFIGMAIEGKADINAIAPGVSGALLTTVVGLLVAIPAVIGYNLLISQVKNCAVRLDNFSEDLLSYIKASNED